MRQEPADRSPANRAVHTGVAAANPLSDLPVSSRGMAGRAALIRPGTDPDTKSLTEFLHPLVPLSFGPGAVTKAKPRLTSLGVPGNDPGVQFLPQNQPTASLVPIRAQAMRHTRPARQNPPRKALRRLPALAATNGLCEHRSAGRTVDARGNWANVPRAVAPARVLLSHHHDKRRTAAFCRPRPF